MSAVALAKENPHLGARPPSVAIGRKLSRPRKRKITITRKIGTER
jgi:hypothetical protein